MNEKPETRDYDAEYLSYKAGIKKERERIVKLLPIIPRRFDHNKTCFDCVERIKRQALKGGK